MKKTNVHKLKKGDKVKHKRYGVCSVQETIQETIVSRFNDFCLTLCPDTEDGRELIKQDGWEKGYFRVVNAREINPFTADEKLQIGGKIVISPDGLVAGHFHAYSVIVDWRSEYTPKTPMIYAMPGYGEHWWGTSLRDAPTFRKEIAEMGGKPSGQSQKSWDSLNEAIRFAEFLSENPFGSLPPAEWVEKVTNFYLSLNNGLEEERWVFYLVHQRQSPF